MPKRSRSKHLHRSRQAVKRKKAEKDENREAVNSSLHLTPAEVVTFGEENLKQQTIDDRERYVWHCSCAK
jgi:hypothetical protein